MCIRNREHACRELDKVFRSAGDLGSGSNIAGGQIREELRHGCFRKAAFYQRRDNLVDSGVFDLARKDCNKNSG